MKIATAWSTHPASENAAAEAFETLSEKLKGFPDLMILHVSCLYDVNTVLRRLGSLAPDVPIQGGTTCLGVMTEAGFHAREGRGLGILGVLDPEGSYGAGIEASGTDPEKAARAAIDQALGQAGRPGEVPAAILITIHPGHEDQVIRVLEKHVGANVPIIGGTSADNDMSGQWRQFANQTVAQESISVAALFPSAELGYAFHSGYEPTACRGRVTRSKNRILYEIDNLPAARVYNKWTGGLIRDVLPGGGSIVPAATFSPLGNQIGQIGGIPYYRLSYPVEVLEDEALLLFTDVHEGNEIVLMTGTHESLASRAGRVADASVEAASFGPEETQGALVLFCAGCMLVIQDRMDEPAAGLKTALSDAPYLCAFTLGEQGCFIGGENRHGNLMIAVLVFGPMKEE